MQLTTMHPEDVKAALRKRFGTISNFEKTKQLPAKSVNDVLRGRPNARVTAAVEEALNNPSLATDQSEVSDNSEDCVYAHRLISTGR